jgi:hypothetical protein
MPGRKRNLLRHIVATLAYRGAKTVHGAPKEFGDFRVGESSRTPREILSHISDVLMWALAMATGEEAERDTKERTWTEEVDRFFESLSALDDYLESNSPLHASAEKIFQGPIADALTHVGQLAMLRRLAGSPVRGENYFRARIESGVVGPEQPKPDREFD